jgi:fructoselysine-6-P-deglycase FrlB-like protein
MSHVKAEIATQPECWRQAAKLAASPGLPARGERVAVVGCGTSWFMAKSYAVLREQLEHGETDAFQASDFPYGRRYDRLVAITRSGSTTETLDVMRAVGEHTPVTVFTADAAQQAAEIADHAIVLDFADEQSVVQTRFATSVLATLRTHLGHDIEAAAADAEVAIRLPLPVHPSLVDQITFLGRGWTFGLAEEAALKCRETAGFWTESYPAMDYRHGPIAIAGPRRVVWAFGDVPSGLAEEVERTGAAFVHSKHHGGYGSIGRWVGGRAPLDPMADLILAQRVALSLATTQGLDPDHPRNLSRSVVLT